MSMTFPTTVKAGARFSREVISADFERGFQITKPRLENLTSIVQMGDGEGDHFKATLTGNESFPRLLYGDVEYFDKIGDYVWPVFPFTFFWGLQATDDELRDARRPVIPQKARSAGARMRVFLEKMLIENIVEQTSTGTPFDGFDKRTLFSTDHRWDTTFAPGVPVATGAGRIPQSNIFTSGGTGPYTSTDQIIDDVFLALELLDSAVDNQGAPLDAGEGEIILLAGSRNGLLRKLLRLAFDPVTKPGDDTDRIGQSMGVKLVFSPFVDNTAANRWNFYLFRMVPGEPPPLMLLMRQGNEPETWREPRKRMNMFQNVFRSGFSWINWTRSVKVVRPQT